MGLTSRLVKLFSRLDGGDMFRMVSFRQHAERLHHHVVGSTIKTPALTVPSQRPGPFRRVSWRPGSDNSRA
jgi:hypothetical protein